MSYSTSTVRIVAFLVLLVTLLRGGGVAHAVEVVIEALAVEGAAAPGMPGWTFDAIASPFLNGPQGVQLNWQGFALSASGDAAFVARVKKENDAAAQKLDATYLRRDGKLLLVGRSNEEVRVSEGGGGARVGNMGGMNHLQMVPDGLTWCAGFGDRVTARIVNTDGKPSRELVWWGRYVEALAVFADGSAVFASGGNRDRSIIFRKPDGTQKTLVAIGQAVPGFPAPSTLRFINGWHPIPGGAVFSGSVLSTGLDRLDTTAVWAVNEREATVLSSTRDCVGDGARKESALREHQSAVATANSDGCIVLIIGSQLYVGEPPKVSHIKLDTKMDAPGLVYNWLVRSDGRQFGFYSRLDTRNDSTVSIQVLDGVQVRPLLHAQFAAIGPDGRKDVFRVSRSVVNEAGQAVVQAIWKDGRTNGSSLWFVNELEKAQPALILAAGSKITVAPGDERKVRSVTLCMPWLAHDVNPTNSSAWATRWLTDQGRFLFVAVFEPEPGVREASSGLFLASVPKARK